jgi:hypothetical protein
MTASSGPMAAKQALDLYFLDNRARMLEIAAFLDRIDRYPGASEAMSDYRYRSFLKALKIIFESKQDRTIKIQQLFSDMTIEPIERVVDGKAYGAWKGADLEDY